MSELLRAIRDLVQGAVSGSTRESSKAYIDAVDALERCSGVQKWSTLVFRWNEYEIEFGFEERIEDAVELLDAIQPLNLSSAPELVDVLPTGKGHSAIVRRYKVEPGEQIVPLNSTSIMPTLAAQERALDDMRTLASHGQIHAYARGGFHWFISSKSGRLLLNAWGGLREASESEANEIMERVQRVFQNAEEAHAKNRIRQTFGVSRVLLPVIHPVSWEQALASTQIAVDAGVKGIFLINQGLDVEGVLRLVLEVRRRHPALWVGLNLLGYAPAQALETALAACEGRIDGIWSDNAAVEEDAVAQPRAQAFLDARARHGWQGLYFGGVAFKYQREVSADKLPVATRLADQYMDVICTSGPGTGQQADPKKISTMRAAVGPGGSIALASGVTAENVSHYLPFVNAYLVGTGLERSFGVLDPAKVAALQSAISGYGL